MTRKINCTSNSLVKQLHSCIKVVTDIGGFGCQSEVIWKIFERVILIIQRIVRMSPDLRFVLSVSWQLASR